MQTTICFDFGNTRLKCAVFKNSDIQEVIVLENDATETIQQLINQFQPKKTILSSVINHNTSIEPLLASQTKFHKLGYESKLKFISPVGKPETIGSDRLAIISAAIDLYPKQHNLIIALGSCITYNFVNKFHEFLGGGISPGMEMRFKSMNQYTAKLPLITPDWNFPLVGYDTKTNLLSGVILGMAKEIDGIIDEYRLKYSNFNAVLTGGDIGYFVPHLKNKIFADLNLIFKGLYAISENNN